MKLGMKDTVRLVVNSVSDGIMDKKDACATLEEAIESYIMECSQSRLDSWDSGYPFDSMTVEAAERLYLDKGFVTLCEDGHVVGIYKERGIAA